MQFVLKVTSRMGLLEGINKYILPDFYCSLLKFFRGTAVLMGSIFIDFCYFNLGLEISRMFPIRDS